MAGLAVIVFPIAVGWERAAGFQSEVLVAVTRTTPDRVARAGAAAGISRPTTTALHSAPVVLAMVRARRAARLTSRFSVGRVDI